MQFLKLDLLDYSSDVSFTWFNPSLSLNSNFKKVFYITCTTCCRAARASCLTCSHILRASFPTCSCVSHASCLTCSCASCVLWPKYSRAPLASCHTCSRASRVSCLTCFVLCVPLSFMSLFFLCTPSALYLAFSIRCATRGERGGGLPCLFLKIEKSALILGKKGPDSVYFWVKYSIQNVVLRVSRRKSPKFSLRGPFSCVFEKLFIEMP